MPHLRDKIVTIRRPHKCYGCGDMHWPGEQMESNTGVWEGEISTIYWCLICYPFKNARGFWDNYEDGICQLELLEDKDYLTHRYNFLYGNQGSRDNF